MSNDIIALMHNFTLMEKGAICRGFSGKEIKLEYKSDSAPKTIKEKLIEAKSDGTVLFKKAGETTKTSAELKKEGKPEYKGKV